MPPTGVGTSGAVADARRGNMRCKRARAGASAAPRVGTHRRPPIRGHHQRSVGTTSDPWGTTSDPWASYSPDAHRCRRGPAREDVRIPKGTRTLGTRHATGRFGAASYSPDAHRWWPGPGARNVRIPEGTRTLGTRHATGRFGGFVFPRRASPRAAPISAAEKPGHERNRRSRSTDQTTPAPGAASPLHYTRRR
jgi:hypothetical protein